MKKLFVLFLSIMFVLSMSVVVFADDGGQNANVHTGIQNAPAQAGTVDSGTVMKQGSDAGMEMHHIHVMMNHGLKMVTEGSNMVMLSDMEMAPGLDKTTHEHGHSMIEKGKAVILQSLNGPEMMSMMKGDHAKSDMMQNTHVLGTQMLKIVGMLEEMSKAGPVKSDMMTMHHQNITINHGLGIALQGSNIKMLGQMGMAGTVDNFSLKHGSMMIEKGRTLINSVMGDKAMMDMHDSGKSPVKDPMMMNTHKLVESAMKIIDELSKM